MNMLGALMRALSMVLLGACLLSAKISAQGIGEPALKEIQIEASAFSVGDAVPAWAEDVAIPDLAEKHAVAMRLADTQYFLDRTPTVYVRRAIAINDAAALTSMGQISIAFVPQYHKVKLHAVRVLRGGESLDRTASSLVRFLQRETGLEQGVYSGEVTASILVNDLRVGDTLEYSFSREGQNPVFGDKFVDVASWDYFYPSLQRRVVVSHPAGRKISWKVIGGNSKQIVPVESEHAGVRRLLFEERSMPGIQPEAGTPPDHNPYRWLQFSEFSGWEDVVAWADALFQFPEPIDEEFQDLVRKLRALPTNEARIAAALEFVQSEIRYFSVSLGESSHRPASPSIVLKRRYGDCKDKSLFLIMLLRALGVEGRPALMTVNHRRGMERSLPSPQLFNHVVVEVRLKGQTHYLDPARLGQYGRLERMGQAHTQAQVLLVAPGTRQLSTILEPGPRGSPHSEVFESATLPKFGGEGRIDVRQVWHGVSAETIRVMHRHMPREQIMKSYDDAMEQRYPGAKMVGEPKFDDDRDRNLFSVSTSYSIPKMAIEHQGNWFVKYLPTNLRGTLTSATSSTRTAPLHLPAFPYYARYTFEIKLPDAVSIVTDPRAVTVKNKHFSYTVASYFRGSTAKATIEMQVVADQVAPADLQKYSEDLRAVGTATAGAIGVPKGAIKSGKMARKDFATTLRDRLQDTIAKTTQAISSGRLSGGDLAMAYCLRSNARMDLGLAEEGISDANEALKAAPLAPDTLQCRGYAHFSAGEFEKSVADYSKAITLGANERAFHLRGISKFYAGSLEAAAEDFAKASNTADKDAQAYSDLWLSWTYRRLGKSLPEDVQKRAAEEPRGAWPRPALAVLAGELAPAELLKIIGRKTGDEGQMTSSEGYFYLGQHYLAQGDRAKARELFQKTRQMNVVIYMEHKAAGFELQRLQETAGTDPLDDAPADKSAAGKRAKRPADARPKKSAPADQNWRTGVFGQ
jgi:lipoprotein NlpI/transglutaminase-like putative cysteine protease